MRLPSESGQATVEAAFLLPALFVVFGLLLQPVICLYVRSAMGSAAAETCRVAGAGDVEDSALTAYAVRRLGTVPNLEAFHRGGSGGWEVSCEREEGGAKVTIRHELRPLPLLGVAAGLSGAMVPGGNLEQTVCISSSIRPPWATMLEGAPDDWISAWD